MSKNKKWSSAAKLEIVLLALKGEMTLNEICKRYEVAPSMVHGWKKQLLEHGSQLFDKGDKAGAVDAANNERIQSKLYEKIGKLTVERDFLKKSWEKLQGNFDDN